MRKLMMAVATAASLAACRSDGGPVGPDTPLVEGSYSLRTVNGAALPFLYGQDGGDRLEITGGRFTFSAEGACTYILEWRITAGTGAHPAQSGTVCTFSQAGSGVTITTATHTFTGVVAGERVTIVFPDFTAEYQR